MSGRRVDGSLDATGGSTDRPNRVRPVAGHLPPTRETVDRILREVRRCTRDDIRMNVFMLDTTPSGLVHRGHQPREWGRAFSTTDEDLGDYVLVDFVEHRRTVSRTH